MIDAKLVAALVIATAAALALPAACVSSSDSDPIAFSCPSVGLEMRDLRIVSQVVERRCGTLDCHGDPSRNLRIYSQVGLRLKEDSGGDIETTDEELAQNRLAMCGLEPEQMDAVVEERADADSLTLVRKARLVEAHKGGRVLVERSPGDVCLISWIEGDTDATACDEELAIP